MDELMLGFFNYLGKVALENEKRRRIKNNKNEEYICSTIDDNEYSENDRVNIKDALKDYPFIYQNKVLVNEVNIKSLIKVITSIDFREFLNINVPSNEYFECIVIPDNVAKVGRGPGGHFRYVSFYPELKAIHDSFDIFDLLKNTFGDTIYEAIKRFLDFYGFEVVGERAFIEYWRKEQVEKYDTNIHKLESFKETMADTFPKLYKYSKKNLEILIKLNQIAKENVYSLQESIDYVAVFFTSVRHVEGCLMLEGIKCKKSKVSNAINTFAVLELIKKVSQENIPKHLLEKAKEEAEKLNRNHIINFYVIPAINDDILAVAEKRVEQLMSKKIPATKINYANTKKVFGGLFADIVFCNIPLFHKKSVPQPQYCKY